MSASNLFHGHHLPVAGSDKEPLQAIGARFDTPDALLDAVRLLREGGFTRYECYTPYPVHGLDRAMRLPKSVLSLLVLGERGSDGPCEHGHRGNGRELQ